MTTNPEQAVLDDIDALVDWQLQQEASGYDHNINQPQCRCGEDWHALPITQRLQSARWYYQLTGEQPDWYRYEEDSSHTLCPGSETEGPVMVCWCLGCASQRMRELLFESLNLPAPALWQMPANPLEIGNPFEIGWFQGRPPQFGESAVPPRAGSGGRGADAQLFVFDEISDYEPPAPTYTDETHWLTAAQIAAIAETTGRPRPYSDGPTVRYWDRVGVEMPNGSIEFTTAAEAVNAEIVLEPAENYRAQRRNARPQNPPMWAVDPSRSRRPRHERGHRRVR